MAKVTKHSYGAEMPKNKLDGLKAYQTHYPNQYKSVLDVGCGVIFIATYHQLDSLDHTQV